jgi:hypothetical protein
MDFYRDPQRLRTDAELISSLQRDNVPGYFQKMDPLTHLLEQNSVWIPLLETKVS